LKIANELVCLQMIISEPIDIPIIDTIIELEERNREDLLELVKLVYPEYFKSKTATLELLWYLQRRSTSCCYR
jgi:hypothetical protein